jgi:thiol-disulfide isomerase/thioredoxin
MRLLLLFCFALSYCVVYSQYDFTLEGSTPANFNNKKVYLSISDNYSDDKYKISDSALVQNNSFSFKGSLQKPAEYATLSTKAKEVFGFFYLVVESGRNTVIVRPLAPRATLFKNKLSNSEVLNSASNQVLKSIDSLINYYYLTKGKPAPKNKYLLRLSEQDKQDLKNKEMNIIKAQPTLFYSLVHTFKLTKAIGGFRMDEAQEVLASLSKELQQSALGKELQELITTTKATLVGSTVPAFTVKTNTESFFSNDSLLGKPYILAFGATWCKPCKEKIPYLNKLQEKYKSKELNVVYVNLDEKVEIWRKQIDTYKMNRWINVSEGVKWEASEMAKRFKVAAVPFYFVVDGSGKIVYNMNELKDYDGVHFEESIKKL